jgi:hypothetical protein
VQHDWTACFFLHKGERARRRDLRTHKYAAVMCCDMLQKVRQLIISTHTNSSNIRKTMLSEVEPEPLVTQPVVKYTCAAPPITPKVPHSLQNVGYT